MTTKEFNCTYGSGKTEDVVYVYYAHGGLKWYVVDGSVNVNATYDEIEDGVDVEELYDVDFFTAPRPVNNVNELERIVEL